MSRKPQPVGSASIQAVVDALSVGLGRAVVFDDTNLVPIAYSRQWDVDEVRSQSILSRATAPAVRDALLGQIGSARDAIHTAADAQLGMSSRVCMPVRDRGTLLGYLWLLDSDEDLEDGQLRRLRDGARELAAIVSGRNERAVPDEEGLVQALRSLDPGARKRAAEEAHRRRLIAGDRAILCLLAAPRGGGDPVAAARQVVWRLSVGHAIAATTSEGAGLVASVGDPVLRMLPAEEVAGWVLAAAGGRVVVGQSGEAALSNFGEASRQASLALRVARARTRERACASYAALGADRLIAQLPSEAILDVPQKLAHLLREEPTLAATLSAFLETGGDVKSSAAALSLHRSGLYYRLKRIEELTGLALDRGDDRLLAHLAIRVLAIS